MNRGDNKHQSEKKKKRVSEKNYKLEGIFLPVLSQDQNTGLKISCN